MIDVQLNFISSDSEISLERSTVLYPFSGESYTCFRGQAVSARNTTVFTWTSAVKALCALLLRYVLFQEDEERSVLSGLAGSAASSLDHAFSKEPQWLLDFFGVDESGRSRARRIFYRLNPERKRPGPVIIGVRSSVVPKERVKISVNGELLFDSRTLEHLLSQLTGETELGNSKTSQGSLGEAFRSAAISEILEMLEATDIFTISGLRNVAARIGKYQCYRDIPTEKILPERELRLPPSARLGHWRGIGSPVLTSGLTVATSPALFAANALIFSLKSRLGELLTVDYYYPYSDELVNAALQDRARTSPDLLIVPVAVASKLISHARSDYKPLMVLPSVSHQILKMPSAKSARVHQCGFVTEFPSTSGLVFEELGREVREQAGKISVCHMEHMEVSRAFAAGTSDLVTVQWFPNSFFLKNVFGAVAVLGAKEANAKETILFGHESLCGSDETSLFISVAIRDAWLRLRGSPTEVQRVVDFMLEDRAYFDLLCRAAGVAPDQPMLVNKRNVSLVVNG